VFRYQFVCVANSVTVCLVLPPLVEIRLLLLCLFLSCMRPFKRELYQFLEEWGAKTGVCRK
jgi:hypothetical protein